ncbi:hypothetical protein ACEOWJ_002818 [Bacillus cereus]|uniref:hypothetical protein n=1 Tax=Bacillus TaxID=1386 RepID=UPI000B873C41|nr:hypothetical protein [Bacillus sp. 491mf]
MLNAPAIVLYRWDNDGKLKAFRTPTNRKYYKYEQYLEYTGSSKKQIGRKTIIYTRVQLLIILHIFSCRIYGLRKYKKKIAKDEEVEKSLQDRN